LRRLSNGIRPTESFLVNIFLLSGDHADPVFYYEEDEDSPKLPRHQGLRGWLETTSIRMRAALRGSNGPVLRRLKQAWEWLQRRIHPDESLFVALRRASTIAIYHGMSLSSDEAFDRWFLYLKSRRRRHIPWLIFNAVLSPMALLLALLPGPNVIGYWFAYRAVRHLLILLGIRRVLERRVKLIAYPRQDLDPSGALIDDEWLTQVASRYNLDVKGVREYVARTRRRWVPTQDIDPLPSEKDEDVTMRVTGLSSGTQRPCDF
jgi:hypothetical protein